LKSFSSGENENITKCPNRITVMKSLHLCASLLGVCLSWAVPTLVHARELPFHLVDFSINDWRLSHQAKRTLSEDAELSKLPLGTTVKDRVVTVFGVVPTAELAKKVETVLKAIPGVASVISEIKVEAPEDTTAKDIASEVRKRVREKTDASAAYSESARAPRGTTAEPTADVRKSLKPPVTLGEPEADRPTSVRTEERSSSLEQIRREAKSLGLSVELRGGDIILSGRVEKMSDAWDIAEKLANVPEANRVIFGTLKKR
jgi:osmotically-inducible protein OsmY